MKARTVVGRGEKSASDPGSELYYYWEGSRRKKVAKIIGETSKQ